MDQEQDQLLVKDDQTTYENFALSKSTAVVTTIHYVSLL